jgi:spermidine/putrescine transport system permease protein
VSSAGEPLGRIGRASLGAYYGLLTLFLYAPLAVIVVFSFNNSTIPALPLSGFTTRWYHAALNDPTLLEAVKLSVEIAMASAIAATALGVLASLGLAGRKVVLRPVVTVLLVLPLVVPAIVLGVGLLILLNQVGSAPSSVALVAAHVVITVPYTVLILLPRLRTLEASLTEAARDLGASHLSAFWLVTRPLLTPAILSSLIVGFTISFDEYAIASFLIPPGQRTFPIFVYEGSKVPQQRPELLAVASVVILLALVLVALSEAGRHWYERHQVADV